MKVLLIFTYIIFYYNSNIMNIYDCFMYFDEDLLRKLKRDKRFFYQRGNKRGLPKYIKEIGDITPWAYSIQRWKNFDDETDVYTGNK